MKVEVTVNIFHTFTQDIDEKYIGKDSHNWDCLTEEGFKKIVEPIENQLTDVFGGAQVISISPIGENPIYEC